MIPIRKNHPFSQIIIILVGLYQVGTRPATAQVIPDTTLGNENSVVTPDVNIQGTPSDRIDGGSTRSSSLFHSFEQFNIEEGDNVYFSNPIGIENIFTRVTGNDISEISGTLGVDGEANLFFLNPNGIIFGENSRLDVRGAFLASTANQFNFSENQVFSAIDPQAPPLLTINAPVGLQHGRNAGGEILNLGNLVSNGDLTFDANNLTVEGNLRSDRNIVLQAQDTLRVIDSALSPTVIAAQNELFVQGREIDISNSNHLDSRLISGDDMVLQSLNAIGSNTRFVSGGDFRVQQLDDRPGSLNSPRGSNIYASGNVSLRNYEGASLSILTGGSVDISGRILINGLNTTEPFTEQVRLSNGSLVRIDNASTPTVDIRAGISPDKLIDLSGGDLRNFILPSNANLSTNFRTSADIRADINVNQIILNGDTLGNVLLTNKYEANSSLDGDVSIGLIGTNSGDLAIESRNMMTLLGSINATPSTSNIISSLGGDILLVAAGDIILVPTDQNIFSLSTSIVSEGTNGGAITIESNGEVSLSGGFIVNRISADNPSIRGDDIRITANSLSLKDGAVISTRVSDQGQAGNIDLDIENETIVDGIETRNREFPIVSAILSQVEDEAIGRSGNISIQTNSLTVQNGGIVHTLNTGNGEAGSIKIAANDLVRIQGVSSFREFPLVSSIISSALRGSSVGVSIDAHQLLIEDGGILSSLALSSGGQGGDITINAETVQLSGRSVRELLGIEFPFISGITTSVAFGANSDGGNIVLNVGDLSILDNANILTGTFGEGKAGNINIAARNDILLDQGFINSSVGFNATEDGGDINIHGRSLNLRGGAQISAGVSQATDVTEEGGRGNGGNINITTSENVDISGTRSTAEVLNLLTNPFFASINEVQSLLGLNVPTTPSLSAGGFSSGLITSTEQGARGRGGNISVRTRAFRISDGAVVEALTANSSRAGDIDIKANSFETVDGGQIITTTLEAGRAGDITLQIDDSVMITGFDSTFDERLEQFGPDNGFGSNTVTNQGASSGLFANTAIDSTGNGGNIAITTHGNLSLIEEGIITTSTAGDGNAGVVTIREANNVSLFNGARLSSTSTDAATGAAGGIVIDAETLILSNQAQATVSSEGRTVAGNLNITADTVSLNNQAILSAETEAGNDANIKLQVDDTLRLRNQSQISASTESGRGGRIVIRDVDNVHVTNSTISSSARNGEAGSLRIMASEQVTISGDPSNEEPGGLFVESRRSEGGNLTVQANQLVVNDGAAISASTRVGDAGDVIVRVADSIQLAGQGTELSARARQSGGTAGDITVTTNHLAVEDGAAILASNRDARSGRSNITLDGLATLHVNNARISAETRIGEAGNVSIFASDSVRLSNRAILSVETRSDSNVNGNRTSNSPLLRGINSSDSGAENNLPVPVAGNLLIQTHRLEADSNASIRVQSPNGQAGNIEINANQMALNNSEIRATTRANAVSGQDSANVTINGPELLTLDNHSLLSAEALGGANGGNIIINAEDGFIVAVPNNNNDIIATAVEGNGGSIDITTQRLLGLQENSGEFDTLRANQTNDMSVTSSLGTSGVISVNDLGLDPVQAAADLPVETASPPLSQGCTPGGGQGSFTNAGQGGLPPGPGDVRGSDRAWEDISPPDRAADRPIVEAQTWTINDRGQVVLQSEPDTETVQLTCR